MKQGFTIVEVLMAMVVIAVSAVVVLTWEKTSWSTTATTNRLMIATQVVEKQIETQRAFIADNPQINWTIFTSKNSMSLIDSSVTPNLQANWTIYPPDSLKDPHGTIINNVRKVKISIGYGRRPVDTLNVVTAISKNF